MSPHAPPHPCATPGCPALVPRGTPRCPAHTVAARRAFEAARRFDPVRQAAVALYRSVAWKHARAAVLAEHPGCATPGCFEPATEVDHVVALRDGGAPLDAGNLRPYCRRHHSAKSAGSGERYGRR
jgi:5-methylcytosine-specific restriction protein A